MNKSKLINFEVRQNADFYILSQANQQLYLRKNSSDLLVFQQVFLNREYDPVIHLALDNHIEINTIIDAGANIGLTAIQFQKSFPGAQLICLEPDPENHKVLIKNLPPHNWKVDGQIWQKALWSTDQLLELTSDFRDGKEWSRMVKKPTFHSSNPTKVQSISMGSIISALNLSEISILKMDIEGAESDIFSKDTNHDFLSLVKIIALEIHDEIANRHDIYTILRSYGFLLFNAGELTIGMNKNLF